MENLNWYLRMAKEAEERAFWAEGSVWGMVW